MIDARLVPDSQEEITPGEAVAGRILHGLGFAHRPWSLTPQLFAHKPLDLLLREGMGAEMCNRFQLGRTLDALHADGCALLCSERALAVCAQAGMALRFNHRDTTSFALTGAYVPDSEEQAMTLTHGQAKDSRPDWKHAGLALLVSPDGGVPLVSPSWDVNTSDTVIFQARAAALLATLQRSPTPRSVVADSTLYPEAHAANLRALGFRTRMPNALPLVSQVSTPARRWNTWQRLDATPRSQRVA